MVYRRHEPSVAEIDVALRHSLTEIERLIAALRTTPTSQTEWTMLSGLVSGASGHALDRLDKTGQSPKQRFRLRPAAGGDTPDRWLTEAETIHEWLKADPTDSEAWRQLRAVATRGDGAAHRARREGK